MLVVEEGIVLARKYRLLRPAGFGGMAQLWVAKNEATDAEVCVKLLVPETIDDESVKRFRREANAAARLSHRAIVRVFDLLELQENGDISEDEKVSALAIVMELLHGETLGDRLAKVGKLPLPEALDIAVPFLSALAHAHRAGVVHRDVKPDNIFLSTDPDGHVIPKVLDFGVSKITAEPGPTITSDGVVLGTPSFMSPEQARGARAVDARSDVFSAAIVFYMMLSGKNPFEGERFHAVVEAILEREPERLAELPPEIWSVIAKALTKDPNQRYADATELGIALRKAAGRTTPTDPGRPSVRTPLPSVQSVRPEKSSGRLPDAIASEPDLDPAVLARRRAIKIVVAVLGIVSVIGLAALVRGIAATPDVAPRVQAAPAMTLPSAAPVAPPPPPPAPMPEPAPEPAAPPPPRPTVTATVAPPATTTVARPKPPPLPTDPNKPREPSIVRDPGF